MSNWIFESMTLVMLGLILGGIIGIARSLRGR